MTQETSRTRLYDIDFAGDFLGLAPWRMYAEARAGTLPSRRVGRRLYFTLADLEAYQERIRRNGAEGPADAQPAAGVR